MNKIILFFFALYFLFGCKQIKEENKVLKIFVNNIVKLDSTKDLKDGYERYSVVINLENNTDTIISCVIMTCSWQENFFFENDSIFLDQSLCNSNFPEKIKIKPSKKISYKGTLVTIKDPSIFNAKNKFRMGFILTNNESFMDRCKNFTQGQNNFIKDLYSKLEEGERLIWSDSFEINIR